MIIVNTVHYTKHKGMLHIISAVTAEQQQVLVPCIYYSVGYSALTYVANTFYKIIIC